MKKCYKCCNFYEMGGFGGYNSYECMIFGSLDIDQHERDPDTSAETCEFYNIKYKPPKKKVKEDKYKSMPSNCQPFKDF